MKRSLFMMDMVNSGSINGVTRCISVLVNALAKDRAFEVTWVRFTHMINAETRVCEADGYRQIFIPLPGDMQHFLRDAQSRQRFWSVAFDELRPYLTDNPILHIHILNLMEFACLIRRHIHCKVITHLHCLPWKGTYNIAPNLFNQLYDRYYIRKDYRQGSGLIRHAYERLAYTQSDCVICVTECAREFIRRLCPGHTENLQLLTNGIQDWAQEKTYRNTTTNMKCVFVGNAHPGKGIDFILRAMQMILVRYPVSLTIVGAFSGEVRNRIQSTYPFLDLHFTGQVGIDRLKEIYAESDIGLIGSIQEQCSYVAIEMMMAGLPVVTTDVDGLSELFVQGRSAVKIPLMFHPQYGLEVDALQMAEAIIDLGKHPAKRNKMGRQARSQYLKRHTQRRMVAALKKIYHTL